jgi:hypothetical protein
MHFWDLSFHLYSWLLKVVAYWGGPTVRPFAHMKEVTVL